MYNQYRAQMQNNYNDARQYFIANPDALINLESELTSLIKNTIIANKDELLFDYNEASYLNPFWQNYPPEERGRAPVGDQIPWIEVGEHAIGHQLSRLLSKENDISEVGLPSGADNRFIIKSNKIYTITNYTDSAMVYLDIKSVGPRDDAENTVLSPYQVSGDGLWENTQDGLRNSQMIAQGVRASHPFYPAIPPIYALSNGVIAPVVHIFVKPVYKMLSLNSPGHFGQPLDRIRIITLPNGLLLTQNPNYTELHPGLIFPGKDDKSKAPEKVRCRISFPILSSIHSWRVSDINF